MKTLRIKKPTIVWLNWNDVIPSKKKKFNEIKLFDFLFKAYTKIKCADLLIFCDTYNDNDYFNAKKFKVLKNRHGDTYNVVQKNNINIHKSKHHEFIIHSSLDMLQALLNSSTLSLHQVILAYLYECLFICELDAQTRQRHYFVFEFPFNNIEINISISYDSTGESSVTIEWKKLVCGHGMVKSKFIMQDNYIERIADYLISLEKHNV